MRLFYLIVFLLISTFTFAQLKADRDDYTYDPKTEKVYRVNHWVTAGVGLGGMALSTYGIEVLRQKDRLDEAELASLDPDDVPWFDRYGVTRNLEDRVGAEEASDVFFNGAILLPLTLFASKRVRKDFLDVALMYVEAHALNSNTYAWSPLGPSFNNRLRPVAYYPGLDDGTREQGNSRNSFFSGHSSTTALGTYFFTKVLCDYHPNLTGKHKAMLYTAAAIPPLYVSWQRVRALKHFPSDALVGSLVGAFWGVMTPQIHKNWMRKHRSSLTLGGGYDNGVGSMGLSLRF